MCFSAGASFGAGVILTVIGVASIKKTKSPSQIPFASIPLIFAVQQTSEGFLWLALSDPAFAPLQPLATGVFLFFAQILWPVWIPFAILKIESQNRKKKIAKVLLGLGFIVSLYMAFCLLNYPAVASITRNHILYTQDNPELFGAYGILFYILATTAPPFISGIKRMWMLGAPILISYIVTVFAFPDHIVSVWCFFAAIISIVVFAIMHNLRKSDSNALSASAIRHSKEA